MEPDSSIQPGIAGMQTWDFTGLKDQESGTFVFLEPANTPYFSRFPNANLAAQLDTFTYFYMNRTDDVIEVLGIYGTFEYQGLSLETGVNVVPPQSLIRFPASFGNSYSDEVNQIISVEGSSIGAPFDSVRTVNNVKREIHIDAFGEMMTPNGQFETIRSSEQEITVLRTYIYDSGWILVDTSQPDTIINYNWWTNQNGLGFPVVQIEYSPADDTREVTWLTEFLVGTKEAYTLPFQLYPNPATNWMAVQFDNPYQGSFDIIDISGSVVLQGKINNQREDISLPNLHPGMYLLLIKNQNGNLSGFKKFEIQP